MCRSSSSNLAGVTPRTARLRPGFLVTRPSVRVQTIRPIAKASLHVRHRSDFDG